MAKSAKGSWVGKTAAPVFKTYQTAGQLQPAAAPSAPPPVQAAPAPVVPTAPIQLPPDFIFGGGLEPFPTFPSEQIAQPEAAVADEPRARLARALIGSGRSSSVAF